MAIICGGPNSGPWPSETPLATTLPRVISLSIPSTMVMSPTSASDRQTSGAGMMPIAAGRPCRKVAASILTNAKPAALSAVNS